MASRSSQRSVLRGVTEPRVFTPPLRALSPDTSLGWECIAFARDVLGVRLYPWQEWLLQHALELSEDGTFRFRKVFVLIGRQNGKSTLLQILSLWRMFLDGAPLVLGTAQDRNLARDQFTGALEIAQGVDELSDEIAEASLQRGFEKMILSSGEQYRIAASNRRAGRGLSVDLLLMDELREHQSWDAWSAVSKTTNARPKAQIWAVSNAGDAASVVLRHFRKVAHEALGDPDGLCRDPVTGAELPSDAPEDVGDDDSLGIFEWSAEPGCSKWDRHAWAQANPSLGFGALTERTIASDARSDPEWVFRTEVLCQWYDGAQSGPFPPGAWEAGRDDESVMSADGSVGVGLDMSWDRSVVHVAFAGFRPDGAVHVEVVASRAGTEWVVPWLESPDRTREFKAVAWQANGAPISSMTEVLEASDLPTSRWQGADLARGTGQFYDLVRAPADEGASGARLFHRSQPILDVPAATAAVKPGGDAWLWDRSKSVSDIAPLVAATAAVWALLHEEENKPIVSAYETHGLTVL